ncbi:cytochrome b5 domain-containing protein [Lactobacillus sp.]|uniref:cytochrome b5 domain-containing protein n=1 Tax=Lactobacillus sp. TaxID=1591 RepID=UPI0019915455|nr:cytochrome b5 domain-containing protein [Lactobacillus sp.]MBD5429666.1 cytochrome B5 [Lactobacillus sp.]
MAEKFFTREELSEFDGENGHKAYFAVDGTVYDATGNSHVGASKNHGNLAGKDITQILQHAPHGAAVIKGLPVVGKLSD